MKNIPDFSVAAVVRSMLADTWHKVMSLEHIASRELEEQHGKVSRHNACKLPVTALGRRDMTVSGSSGSNYLVGQQTAGYLPSLQPASTVLRLGASTYDAGPGHVVLPTGSAATTQWLSDENAAITETQPTFGQVSSTPRILSALIEVSHQLLTQSNVEELLRAELQRAAGTALDKAAIQGTGVSGQPTGIVNTSSVGAFTGASLNRSALTNAQLDVATANAIVSGRVGYITTPTIANTLANRADTIETTRAVWQGPLHSGALCGAAALSSENCPASTAVYGDWGNLTLISWGVPEIAVDPMTKFNQGIVAVRLLMLCDIVVTRAAGFSVATSVS